MNKEISEEKQRADYFNNEYLKTKSSLDKTENDLKKL